MMKESCLWTRNGRTNGFEKRGICPKSAYSPFLSIKTKFKAHYLKNRCIGDPECELRKRVPRAGRDRQHVEHLLWPYWFNRGYIMQNGLAGDLVKPRGVLLRCSEACVKGICVVGHDRSNLTAQRDKLLKLLKYLGERTERAADRESHAQSRKFIYIAHKFCPFSVIYVVGRASCAISEIFFNAPVISSAIHIPAAFGEHFPGSPDA